MMVTLIIMVSNKALILKAVMVMIFLMRLIRNVRGNFIRKKPQQSPFPTFPLIDSHLLANRLTHACHRHHLDHVHQRHHHHHQVLSMLTLAEMLVIDRFGKS